MKMDFMQHFLTYIRREIIKIETEGEKQSKIKIPGIKESEDTKSRGLRITLERTRSHRG